MVTRGYWSDLRALSKRMPAAFQVLILITERMNKSNALVISQATWADAWLRSHHHSQGHKTT